jgi:hypothetical protein
MKILKHLCFIGIVVLLASAMVSCDFVEKPEVPGDNIVGYTEDGRPLISLTIGTGGGRALTTANAKGSLFYYEVVFKDSKDAIYRVSWNYTQQGRIALPADKYDGPGEAILFAGDSNKTLLAIGEMTFPDDGEISAKTTSITFTLVALETDVSDIPGHPAIPVNIPAPGDPAIDAVPGSTFKITGPADYATYLPVERDLVDTLLPKAKVRIGTVSSYYPVFEVPKGAAAPDTISATFEVGNIADFAEGIVEAGTAKIVAVNVPVESESGDPLGPSPEVGGGTFTADFTTGTFTIADITTTDNSGFVQISIQIPVAAISDTAVPAGNGGEPVIWYIRGGSDNQNLDPGKDATRNRGGAILLGVGDISSHTIIIVGP